MQNDSSYIERRMKSDYKFHTEKLKNLFHFIYKDEELAWSIWRHRNIQHGFDKTAQALHNKPKILGKMRGRNIYGFFRNQEFFDRERAIKEVKYNAEKWRVSLMQLEQSQIKLHGQERWNDKIEQCREWDKYRISKQKEISKQRQKEVRQASLER